MTDKKGLRIVITFKADEKWLYDKISKHSSRSGWIKDLLKQYFEQEASNEQKN